MGNYVCNLAGCGKENVDNYYFSYYLVVGGGNSAGYLANFFVENGIKPGKCMILSEEDVLPYERPALSKAFLTSSTVRLPGFNTCVGGGGPRQDLTWYNENGISVLLSVKVTNIDFVKKVVSTDKDTTYGYQKLILATGCDPIRLRCKGSNLEGIYYLRNHEDAHKLVRGINSAKSSDKKNVVVVGGGYIAMEVAAALCINGLSVTMVFPEQWMLERLFTKKLGTFYEEYYKEKGIKIIKTKVVGFAGDEGNVASVIIENGPPVEASMVVVGIGARPRSELFADKLHTEGGGLVVNEHFQTNDPDVFAIGDIAHFPLKRYNRRQRMEHVAHCRSSAAHCVDFLTAAPVMIPAYDYLPFFYSRVFELSWKFYGDPVGEVAHIGSLKPTILDRSSLLLAVWIGEVEDSNGEKRINGVFLDSGTSGDDQYVELIKQVAMKRPIISKEQKDKLFSWGMKVKSAFEILELVVSAA